MPGFFYCWGPFVAVAPPNYHIKLWPEPPGPPTYLCLIPECTYADATLAEIQAHVVTVHSLEPVPTPLAADPSVLPTLTTEETTDEPH